MTNEIVAIESPAALDQTRPANMSGAQNDQMMIDLFIGSRKSDNTKDTYRRAIKAFTAHTGKTLAMTTAIDFQSYVELVSADGANLATVSAKVAPIKSLFSYAQKLGYIQFNVGAATQLKKASRMIDHKVVSESDLKKFLAAVGKGSNHHRAKTQTHWLIVYCLYATGARVSEYLALQKKDVIQRDGKTVFNFRAENTKGNKDRSIELPQFLADELKQHIDTDEDQSPDSYVFNRVYAGKAGPLTRQSVNQMMTRVCDAHGLPRVTPHMLRHSVATHARAAGLPIADLAAKLGNSVQVVADFYDHNDSSAAFETALL